jgi:serine/threonine-protein kinase
MAEVKPGDRVGQYVLRRELGRGAMATVFEAEHAALGKRVALKRMHPHLAADPTAAARFMREGKAATQIRSPHVVDVFDVASDDGVPFLVMELLEGADLAAALRERRKLPLQEIADLVVPVAVATQAAHEAGVIHRDLKPGNILLTRRGDGVSPIVLDFGISKILTDVERDLTASEVLLGTVHYMSPEQTRGGRAASALSDQYALGVILYECATGAKPFAGSTPYAVMHAIVSARVTPPSVLDPALPAAFDEVVLRAMSRDARKRYPSVRALGAALLAWASPGTRRRYAAELGVDASAPTARRGRKWRAVVAAGAVIVAAVVVARLRAGPAERPVAAGAVEPAPPVQQEVPVVAAASTAPPPPASASTTAPVRRAAPRPSSSAAPPEHGTNGALILE